MSTDLPEEEIFCAGGLKLPASQAFFGPQSQEMWSIQLPIPAGKEDIFPRRKRAPAEACQQHWIYGVAWVDYAQAGCCMMCFWAALIYQPVCSELGTLRQNVPTGR